MTASMSIFRPAAATRSVASDRVIDDLDNAKMRAHRSNLARYGWLLTTQLTDSEREFVVRRMDEEQRDIDALQHAGSRAASARRDSGDYGENRA